MKKPTKPDILIVYTMLVYLSLMCAGYYYIVSHQN